MRFPPIPLEQITDYWTQKSLQVIRDWLIGNPSLTGFKQYEVSLTSNYDGGSTRTAFSLPHGLGFKPKDVLITSQTGTGVATFNQNLTDTTNLYIGVTGGPTPTGPLVVRFLAGTYQGAL